MICPLLKVLRKTKETKENHFLQKEGKLFFKINCPILFLKKLGNFFKFLINLILFFLFFLICNEIRK